jgi:hypothetical protein
MQRLFVGSGIGVYNPCLSPVRGTGHGIEAELAALSRVGRSYLTPPACRSCASSCQASSSCTLLDRGPVKWKDSITLSQESRSRAIKMLKRRDTKMSSKGKEIIKPTSLEQSQADKPKELVTQILGQRYMDSQKMQKFFESEFGNNWKMEVCMSLLFRGLWLTRQIKLGRFTIATPRELTEVCELVPYLDTSLTMTEVRTRLSNSQYEHTNAK